MNNEPITRSVVKRIVDSPDENVFFLQKTQIFENILAICPSLYNRGLFRSKAVR